MQLHEPTNDASNGGGRSPKHFHKQIQRADFSFNRADMISGNLGHPFCSRNNINSLNRAKRVTRCAQMWECVWTMFLKRLLLRLWFIVVFALSVWYHRKSVEFGWYLHNLEFLWMNHTLPTCGQSRLELRQNRYQCDDSSGCNLKRKWWSYNGWADNNHRCLFNIEQQSKHTLRLDIQWHAASDCIIW